MAGYAEYILIGSDHTTCSGDEKSERENKDEKTLAVDKIVLLGPWVRPGQRYSATTLVYYNQGGREC